MTLLGPITEGASPVYYYCRKPEDPARVSASQSSTTWIPMQYRPGQFSVNDSDRL